MADVEAAVRAYCAAWVEPDDTARKQLLEQAWSADGTYQDPTTELAGRAALDAHIAGMHQRMPGWRIEQTSAADHHHGMIRFTWRLVDGDGKLVVEGIDFGELDGDGRLRRIVGFFGAPAEMTP